MPEVAGNPSRYLVIAGWNDVPHLSEEAKQKLAASIEPHLRKARMEGLPSMSGGLIYPIEEAEVSVADFEIPPHFPKGYGMDTGWKWTAAVHGALDRENDIVYIYRAYKRSEAEPPSHAAAIKAPGEWIPGVGDAADINKYDGEQFLKIYRKLGLNLELPDKRSVEANILEVWLRLCTGRLKVFQSCLNWFEEFRLYRRNEKGEIIRENDHLMASTQYLCKSGIRRMCIKPIPRPKSTAVVTPWS